MIGIPMSATRDATMPPKGDVNADNEIDHIPAMRNFF
jgi:hypothetical protein